MVSVFIICCRYIDLLAEMGVCDRIKGIDYLFVFIATVVMFGCV